jgi:oxygen-independent coproporphyrinogen-3 oxidase
MVNDKQMLNQYSYDLIREIELYSRLIRESSIKFIYFGGGSPSVLNVEKVARIIESIKSNFSMSDEVEVTFEGHPNHLIKDYVQGLKDSGINRISTGIQSFDDKLLQSIGGYHTTETSMKGISNVYDVLGGISIDLLFNVPNQSIELWRNTLTKAINNNGINHISCYSYVTFNTSLKSSNIEEAIMTIDCHSTMSQHGFRHYASCASGGFDFTREKESLYETLHWSAPQAEFIGVGPGAFGFIDKSTTINTMNYRKYRSDLANDKLPLISLTRTEEHEMIRRYFVLGVKTNNISLSKFKEIYRQDPEILFDNEFRLLDKMNLAKVEDSYLKLTELGRLFTDTISAIFYSKIEKDIPHPEEHHIRKLEQNLND